MEPQEKKTFELQLALACQLGEVMGRLRERRIASQREPGRKTPPEILARAAASNDKLQARELETLGAVQHESWWDTAQQHEVCSMLALSSTWKNVSEAAATVDAHIRGELTSRFGISADVLSYTLPSQDEYRHVPGPPTSPEEHELLPQKQPTEAQPARAERRADGRKKPPEGETPEQRDSRLHSAAMHFGVLIVEGRESREPALERLQGNLPGFPPERYEAALDLAMARIAEGQVQVLARRKKMIAEARELDLLNAVFALRYFNQRSSGHYGEYGLGPIDLFGALGDSHSHEEIGKAVTRADALIKEGIRMGYGPWDHEADMRHLRQAHPGFNDRALSRALDWGHFMGR